MNADTEFQMNNAKLSYIVTLTADVFIEIYIIDIVLSVYLKENYYLLLPTGTNYYLN